MLIPCTPRERSGILHSVFLCAASGYVRARRPAAARSGASRVGRGGARARARAYSNFRFVGFPPRTKVSYRSLAVIVAGLLAILCGYEVAAESFMTD
jgi:hypothetical protein